MIQNNIDIKDAALNTKAPFQCGCPLLLWGSTLPTGSFISIKIYLPETAKPPVRLYSITETAVSFNDAVGAFVGAWELTAETNNQGSYILAPIKNENNVIVGHLAADLYTAVTLKQTASLAGGIFYTTPDDFILLPQCHVQSFEGTGRAIKIGDTIHTNSTTLCTGTRVCASVTNNVCNIGLYGTYTDTLPKNRICTLKVGTSSYDVSDKHLLLIAGVQSNLRITRTGNDLVFRGVKDVQ